MKYLGLKLMAGGSFIILGLVFGLLPIFVESCRKNERVLSFLNAFSAGVFLSVALIHMLADANEEFDEWKEEQEHDDFFPLTYTLVVLGYFVILFIERVIFGKYKLEDFQDTEFQVSADMGYYNSLEEDLDNSKPMATNGRTYSILKKKEMCGGLFSPILLVVGLGMHSLMAGLTLGLSDERKNIINLWLAVGSHKWASAMGIGASYAKKVKYGRKGGCLLVVIFTFVTPIGVAIGLALDGASKLVTSTLTSAAVGMFVYVAVEVSTEEFVKKKDRWKKFGLLIIGVGLIIASTFLQ